MLLANYFAYSISFYSFSNCVKGRHFYYNIHFTMEGTEVLRSKLTWSKVSWLVFILERRYATYFLLFGLILLFFHSLEQKACFIYFLVF